MEDDGINHFLTGDISIFLNIFHIDTDYVTSLIKYESKKDADSQHPFNFYGYYISKSLIPITPLQLPTFEDIDPFVILHKS